MTEHHGDDDLCASGQAKIDRIYRQLEINLKKPSKLAVCAKWFITIVCSSLLLICVIMSKFAVLELASLMTVDGNCGNTTNELQDKCENSFILLVIILLAPNIINLLRFMWTSICNDKRQWPTQTKMFMCVSISMFEAIGLCIFTFKVLTKEKNELVILLMDCVFIGHIIVNNIGDCITIRTSRDKENIFRCIRSAISLISIIAGAILTFYITYTNLIQKSDFAYALVSILCLSVSWLPWLHKSIIQTQHSLENEDEEDNSREAPRSNQSEANSNSAESTNETLACSNSSDNKPTGGPKQDTIEVYTHKILIVSSFTKILTIIIFACVMQNIEQGSDVGILHKLGNGWLLEFDTSTDLGRQKIYLIVNISLSFLGYLIGIYALKTQMNIFGFVLPLLLATPLSFLLLYVPNICNNFDLSQGTRMYIETICVNKIQKEDIEFLLPALFLLWIAQFLSTGFYVLGSSACILQHEIKLFWMPMYNSLFLDQWMLLDRRTILMEEDQYMKSKNQKKETKVYICTTMYRETREEMKQLLESIARINEVKQYGNRNFESHIIVDGGIKNGVAGEKALQLLGLVLDVLKTNGLGTIAASPYGLRLTWSLWPSNGERCNRPMTFVVHLKDSKKVKNKKRWSQVMYMSYILDFLLKQDGKVVEEDAFILTTDADVKFSPDSVEALLDLMTRDTSVGAVCARTYPQGNGPLIWYQEFEYAIGHWLQKTAEHVMGTVLCAPGCFSVYRINAIRDILPIYATDVEKGLEFLIKDMGEDRWLCTLLVQSGWRIDYCAASCNYTNCPAEFDEFFTQRRRWIGSTIANSFLLMKEWSIVNKVNPDLSVWYLVYQSCLMCSTILGPSTVILIISSGLSYAWGVNIITLTCVQCVVVSIFCLICLKASQKTQLLVAKFLTFAYAVLMVFVLIGTVEGTVHNVSGFHRPARTNDIEASKANKSEAEAPMSITTLYVIGVTTLFPVAALIHLSEAACLLKGGAYLLCLPSTYILLIIYSFCNITDRSWGTRDKQEEDTIETESWYTDLGNKLKSMFNQYQRLKDGEKMCVEKVNKGRKDSSIVQESSDDTMTCQSYSGSQHPVITIEPALDMIDTNTVDKQLPMNTDDCDKSDRASNDITDNGTDIQCPDDDHQQYGRKKIRNRIINVEDWVDQPELIHLFKKYGYDNTSFIATMTEADLQRIGIKERTQRNLFIRRINNLQQFSFAASIPDNVYDWLCYIGLDEYTEQFTRCHITITDDLEQLTSFTRKDIEAELKITKPAHIRRLLDAVAYLRTPTKEERIHSTIRQKLKIAPQYAIEMISPEDYSYWNRLIDCFLKPTSDGFRSEWTLKTELEDLRDMWIFILFLVNALWLILIITVALKLDLIIFGSSPVAFGFFVVFGLLLLVQFSCMVIHRLSTLAHFLARTPYRFGDKYQSNWSYTSYDDIQALAEVKKSVEECRRMERLAETDEHNDFRGSHEKTPLMLN